MRKTAILKGKKKKNSGLVENFPDMPQIKMSFKK